MSVCTFSLSFLLFIWQGIQEFLRTLRVSGIHVSVATFVPTRRSPPWSSWIFYDFLRCPIISRFLFNEAKEASFSHDSRPLLRVPRTITVTRARKKKHRKWIKKEGTKKRRIFEWRFVWRTGSIHRVPSSFSRRNWVFERPLQNPTFPPVNKADREIVERGKNGETLVAAITMLGGCFETRFLFYRWLYINYIYIYYIYIYRNIYYENNGSY